MVIRIRVNLSGIAAVGGGVSTFHFSDGSTNPQACADAVQDFWDAFIPAITSSITFQVDPVASTFDTATGALTAVTSLTTEPAKTGTGTGPPLPLATQALARLQTAAIVGNRILKGRLFIPGWHEGSENGVGGPSAAVLALIASAGQALVDDLSAEWVVWHRPVAGVGGTQGLVTDVSGWDQWAVLRSRRD